MGVASGDTAMRVHNFLCIPTLFASAENEGVTGAKVARKGGKLVGVEHPVHDPSTSSVAFHSRTKDTREHSRRLPQC